MSRVYRLQKGSPLTFKELDDNFRFIPDYDSAFNYKVDMLVLYNNQFYVALQSSTGITPGTDPAVWQPIGGGAYPKGNQPITRNTPGLQGFNAGTTNLVDFLTEVFHPPVAATLGTSISGNVFEKGTSQNVTFNANLNPGDDTITSREILKDGTPVNSYTTNSFSYTDNGVTDDSTYTARVGRSGKPNLNSSKSIQFVDPFQFGVADFPTIDGWISAGLFEPIGFNKVVAPKANRTSTYNPTNQRFVIGYPEVYGTLSQVLDPNGFDILPGFQTTVLNYQRPDSTTVAYRVYFLDADTTQSNYDLQIIF